MVKISEYDKYEIRNSIIYYLIVLTTSTGILMGHDVLIYLGFGYVVITLTHSVLLWIKYRSASMDMVHFLYYKPAFKIGVKLFILSLVLLFPLSGLVELGIIDADTTLHTIIFKVIMVSLLVGLGSMYLNLDLLNSIFGDNQSKNLYSNRF